MKKLIIAVLAVLLVGIAVVSGIMVKHHNSAVKVVDDIRIKGTTEDISLQPKSLKPCSVCSEERTYRTTIRIQENEVRISTSSTSKSGGDFSMYGEDFNEALNTINNAENITSADDTIIFEDSEGNVITKEEAIALVKQRMSNM